MKIRIFLSYGRPDSDKVEEVYYRLQDLGLDPWMDTKNLLPGENWPMAIDRAIEECDFFLLCLSKSTIARRGVLQREIKKALDQAQMKLDSDIYIIPARFDNFDECDLPGGLREKHWLDLFQKDYLPKLLQALEEGIRRLGKEFDLKPSVPFTDTSELEINALSHSLLSSEELDYFIKLNADSAAQLRKYREGRFGGESDSEFDWHQGVLRVANDILDGRINFPNRIGSDTYWLLEKTWLEDIKLLRAYDLWERKGHMAFSGQEAKDYLQASEEIQSMLLNREHKANVNMFAQPRKYIEDRYLTDGCIDGSKDGTRKLISQKATRIWEITGNIDLADNWFCAQKYVQLFYENIGPAVVENDAAAVQSILESFTVSDTVKNGHKIINCFEFALAVYFLDIDKLQKCMKRNRFMI